MYILLNNLISYPLIKEWSQVEHAPLTKMGIYGHAKVDMVMQKFSHALCAQPLAPSLLKSYLPLNIAQTLWCCQLSVYQNCMTL